MRKTPLIFAVLLGLGIAGAALAWTGPPAAPTACPSGSAGCDAPINVSGTAQSKSGALNLSGTASLNQTRLYLAGNGDTNHYIEMNNSILGNTMRLHELGNMFLEAANVGIGEPNPNSKLRVAGDVAADAFKDNANFSYVVDPAGSSNVSALVVNNRLTVSEANGAYTYITLRDDESPGGIKYIHANSNVVGFLSGAGSWLSYWQNDGIQRNSGAIYAGGQRVVSLDTWLEGSAYYGSNGDMYLPYVGAWASGTYCRNSGANCPASAGGVGFGGMSGWNSVYGCGNGGQPNPWSGGCSCPWWAPRQWFAGSATLGGTIEQFFYCTIGG